MESEDARNVAAVAALYDQWAHGRPGRYALIAGGGVRATVDGTTATRDAVLTLPGDLAGALVVALWPQEGWRHPRLVIEAYRRTNAPAPAPVSVPVPVPVPASAEPDSPFLSDPTLRGFLLAQRLHGALLAEQGTGTATDPDTQARPYLLIKDGVVLARYKRVTQARQAVAAALPPLAPVIFTSLRLGSLGPFSLMVQQALLDAVGSGQWAVGSGQWAVGSGQWAVTSVACASATAAVGSSRPSVNCLLPTAYFVQRLLQIGLRRARQVASDVTVDDRGDARGEFGAAPVVEAVAAAQEVADQGRVFGAESSGPRRGLRRDSGPPCPVARGR